MLTKVDTLVCNHPQHDTYLIVIFDPNITKIGEY